jgi:predicted Zn-dependent protease with MMP-like domain
MLARAWQRHCQEPDVVNRDHPLTLTGPTDSAEGADATYNKGMAVTMSTDRFEELVADALDTVPDALMKLLDNVVVLVADAPRNGDPHLLGLYEGYPLTERGSGYVAVLPDRISIFRRSILRISNTEEDVVAQVRITVVHEIAHHFGIGDARLHELGWG